MQGPPTAPTEDSEYLISPEEQNSCLIEPTEGGHCTFGARDMQQLLYLEFLRKDYGKEMISLEEAWCGRAIPKMYRFFCK